MLIVGRLHEFVDVCSPVDYHPAAMWEKLAEYLETLPAEEAELPGGRYACAQVLAGRRLPFLQHCSLGEVLREPALGGSARTCIASS